MGVWYATREDVKSALDIKETARSNAQVDRAIESASRAVEGLCHRVFYPWNGVRKFDWPNAQGAMSYRLWLDQFDLLSMSDISSGGDAIDDTILYPNEGPPYDRVEIDLGTSGSFGQGDTHQNDISIEGVWGYTQDTVAAGYVADALGINSSVASVNIPNGALVGVGDTLLINDERVAVTGRSWLDTAVDIHSSDSMLASAADVTILASTTTGIPQAGEVILIDAEKMLVVDVAGSIIVVKRAWDGSVLATHNANSSIYAQRTLSITRGVLGTVAASHSNAASVAKYEWPGLVNTLTVAYAINTLLQQSAGYARVAGTGDNAREFTGRGIAALERDTKTRYGRKARVRGV